MKTNQGKPKSTVLEELMMACGLAIVLAILAGRSHPPLVNVNPDSTNAHFTLEHPLSQE